MASSSNNSPLLAIRNANISFAKKTIFEDISFNIFPGDKICLVGKNGVGKTTLMKLICGKIDANKEEERWVKPGLTIGYLSQSEFLPSNLNAKEFIEQDLKIDESKLYLIDIIFEKLKINQFSKTHSMSGGERRRLHLAKALIIEPEILLLDEPTNHLDLEIIYWLEDYLSSYCGALLVISHDRKFLEKITNKIFWLRAKKIKINSQGYKNFDQWSQMVIDHESRQLYNLEKKLELESQWLQGGITARRKRNIGRLHYLGEIKAKLAAQKKLVRENISKVKINGDKSQELPSQLIASFSNVSKSYQIGEESKNLLKNFSLKIIRGERIGIIGKNGVGKSTFIKLITGDISPDQGKVKTAIDLNISYFDQDRKSINQSTTIKEYLTESGSEYINLANGKTRHICGYLKDFLFDPQEIDTLVSNLSGGQQNRLLLAKILANPGNLLILDEPTNDLDIETLDILEDYLSRYKGTVILVSHDRDFLDNVATSIMAFEGDGVIFNNIGNFSDYINYNPSYLEFSSPVQFKKFKNKSALVEEQNQVTNIFSAKEESELKKIPDRIEQIEAKIQKLYEELLQKIDDLSKTKDLSDKIQEQQNKLQDLEKRWDELERLKAASY